VSGLSMTRHLKIQLSNTGQCCISCDIRPITDFDHSSTIVSFAKVC
jgi:hypothetical protein